MTGLRLLTSPAVLNGRPTSDDDDDITIARKYFSHHAFSDVSVQNYKGDWVEQVEEEGRGAVDWLTVCDLVANYLHLGKTGYYLVIRRIQNKNREKKWLYQNIKCLQGAEIYSECFNESRRREAVNKQRFIE